METKEIIIGPRKLTLNAQGKWTLVDTRYDVNETISEAEAIDILVDCASRNASLKPLIRKHFPMYGFHN